MAGRLAHPRLGLDYAQVADPSIHKAVGSTFAVRYLSRSSWKVLGRGEAARLKAAGINLALVFEDGADRPLQGHDAGVADMEWAHNQAKDLLGYAPRVIYFAYDDDPSGHEEAVWPYYDALRGGAVIPGSYGGYDLQVFLHARGIDYMWQTLAWSRGNLYLPAQLYQFQNDVTAGGVNCDADHAFYADYGQLWLPDQDPHHYARFDRTIRHAPYGKISERGRMLHLDNLLLHHGSKADVERTQTEIGWLFRRLWKVVHTGKHGESLVVGSPEAKKNWAMYHRGWRGKQLYNAARGNRKP